MLGGMWVYNDHIGQDERGGRVPSSMYRELWTNGPKECLEFPDFTFKECFEVPIPSFPSREVMLRYLQKYAEKFDIAKYVQLDTSVEKVTHEDGIFTVTTKTWNENNEEIMFTREFDDLVVATGHFCEPNMPTEYPVEKFTD